MEFFPPLTEHVAFRKRKLFHCLIYFKSYKMNHTIHELQSFSRYTKPLIRSLARNYALLSFIVDTGKWADGKNGLNCPNAMLFENVV